MEIAIVDLYLARTRVRVEIPVLGSNRVSDLFNNHPGEFLTGAVPAEPGGSRQLGGAPILVRLADVRLVRPLYEPVRPPRLDVLRDRSRIRVALDLDHWEVVGDVYVIDRIPWVDYFAAMQGRFLPVSGATLREAGEDTPQECDVVLVNLRRISALQELTAVSAR